jgi:hypothetical protein
MSARGGHRHKIEPEAIKRYLTQHAVAIRALGWRLRVEP